MLLEPAASSQDERSQPVPSRGTRLLPSRRVPAQLPAGDREAKRAGRTQLVGTSDLHPPALSCVCALRCLALLADEVPK